MVRVLLAGNGLIPWFIFSGLVRDVRYQTLAQRFTNVNSLFESFLEAVSFASPFGIASTEFSNGRVQTNDFLTKVPHINSLGEMEPKVEKDARTLGLVQDWLWDIWILWYFVRKSSSALRRLYESILVAAETNRILNTSISGTQCKALADYRGFLGRQLYLQARDQTCLATSSH